MTLPDWLEPRLLWTIGAGIACIIVLLFAWRLYRRRRARAAMLEMVTGGAFDFRRDVLVPDGQGGWVHADFLLLTPRGLIVLDVRDVVGNIFGGDQMTDWTVMQRTRRFTFSNPQTGLYDRIALLRALVQEVPVDGRVLFSARAKFPKGLPRFTLMLESIRSEFPRVDRETSGGVQPAWKQDWLQLVAQLKPSSLGSPEPLF